MKITASHLADESNMRTVVPIMTPQQSDSNSADLPNGICEMILVRLCASGGPVSPSVLRKSIEPFFVHEQGLSARKFRHAVSDAAEILNRDGLSESKPNRPTDAGRCRAAEFLDFGELPKVPWQTLKNRFVVSAALGLCPSPTELRNIGTSQFLYATLIKQHYDLPTDSVPTQTAVLDALAWRQLMTAHPETPPFGKRFTRKAVLEQLLFDGGSTGNPTARLAAMIADLPAPNADRVRQVVIRRWLQDASNRALETAVDGADEGQRTVCRNASTFVGDVDQFVEEIRNIATTDEDGRFGMNKVFIGHLWHKFLDRYPASDRLDFDRNLLAAQRNRKLTLARADLISAMDPMLVRTSEVAVKGGHGAYHFVRLN